MEVKWFNCFGAHIEKIFLDPVIPMYFYVATENVEQEKLESNSTEKQPAKEGIYLWNQALFILAQLLTGGLLHINELDLIRRYLPSYNRPKKGGRYSAFQVNKFILSINK